MQEDCAVAEFLEVFYGVFRAVVGGPEAVELELDSLWNHVAVDVVCEASVDASEFEPVVVLEEFIAVAFEDFIHFGGVFGGALDCIQVLEVVGAISADDSLHSNLVRDVHAFADVAEAARPWAVAGDHVHPKVVDDLPEIAGANVEETCRLDILVADVGDALQKRGVLLDAGKGLANRVELNP